MNNKRKRKKKKKEIYFWLGHGRPDRLSESISENENGILRTHASQIPSSHRIPAGATDVRTYPKEAQIREESLWRAQLGSEPGFFDDSP
jgi:hypothetical protein